MAQEIHASLPTISVSFTCAPCYGSTMFCFVNRQVRCMWNWVSCYGHGCSSFRWFEHDPTTCNGTMPIRMVGCQQQRPNPSLSPVKVTCAISPIRTMPGGDTLSIIKSDGMRNFNLGAGGDLSFGGLVLLAN